jgi:hypothetical protein
LGIEMPDPLGDAAAELTRSGIRLAWILAKATHCYLAAGGRCKFRNHLDVLPDHVSL